jgi:hypothetical protein
VCPPVGAIFIDRDTGPGKRVSTGIDLNKVGRSVTWGGTAIGFVFVTAFVAIVCAASGAIYNRLAH